VKINRSHEMVDAHQSDAEREEDSVRLAGLSQLHAR
jgi:hypothetical protein